MSTAKAELKVPMMAAAERGIYAAQSPKRFEPEKIPGLLRIREVKRHKCRAPAALTGVLISMLRFGKLPLAGNFLHGQGDRVVLCRDENDKLGFIVRHKFGVENRVSSRFIASARLPKFPMQTQPQNGAWRASDNASMSANRR